VKLADQAISEGADEIIKTLAEMQLRERQNV